MNTLITFGVHFLEFLFFAGWLGSIVVVVISGIEDMETIMEKDLPPEKAQVIHQD